MSDVLASFGVVNCNRLFYARSQVKSLLMSLGDDAKKCELIFVDNASVETGTTEFLQNLQASDFRHVKIISNTSRDHKNEFAAALNTIVNAAQSEIIIPLQGDAQFIRHHWLQDVLKAMSRQDCGSVIIDAQRNVTHLKAKEYNALIKVTDELFIDLSRPPLAGAADVAYKTSIIKKYYPWSVTNDAHEGGGDSETKMLQKIKQSQDALSLVCYILANPAMLTIQTDSRGTNARVRSDKRYGAYFAAPENDLYYEMNDKLTLSPNMLTPFSAESVSDAHPSIGWTVTRGQDGSWLKNPIKPELATPTDWTVLS